MTEDQLEQETLVWLHDVGYAVRSGVDIAPDGPAPERANHREVLLLERLRQAVARLNPGIPAAAREDAIALIVPEDTTRFFGDPFFAAIVAGITGGLRNSDYLLNLLIASEDPGDKMVSFVRNGGVDGALIVSHHSSDAFVDTVADAVPVVFGGRPARERAGDFIVDVDNVAGSRLATQRLIEIGRTRVATITGPRDASSRRACQTPYLWRAT